MGYDFMTATSHRGSGRTMPTVKGAIVLRFKSFPLVSNS